MSDLPITAKNRILAVLDNLGLSIPSHPHTEFDIRVDRANAAEVLLEASGLRGALKCLDEALDEVEALRTELYHTQVSLAAIKVAGGFMLPMPAVEVKPRKPTKDDFLAFDASTWPMDALAFREECGYGIAHDYAGVPLGFFGGWQLGQAALVASITEQGLETATGRKPSWGAQDLTAEKPFPEDVE